MAFLVELRTSPQAVGGGVGGEGGRFEWVITQGAATHTYPPTHSYDQTMTQTITPYGQKAGSICIKNLKFKNIQSVVNSFYQKNGKAFF